MSREVECSLNWDNREGQQERNQCAVARVLLGRSREASSRGGRKERTTETQPVSCRYMTGYSCVCV